MQGATNTENSGPRDPSNIDISENQDPPIDDSHNDGTSDVVEEGDGIQDEEEADELLDDDENINDEDEESSFKEPLDVTVEKIDDSENTTQTLEASDISQKATESNVTSKVQSIIFEDPSDEDDGEGDVALWNKEIARYFQGICAIIGLRNESNVSHYNLQARTSSTLPGCSPRPTSTVAFMSASVSANTGKITMCFSDRR